uniref:Uncharacterized protein n=1 Tax=Macrostomum lignano TaxID=282301 RepID=A0A1I8FAJ5_9PLAT
CQPYPTRFRFRRFSSGDRHQPGFPTGSVLKRTALQHYNMPSIETSRQHSAPWCDSLGSVRVSRSSAPNDPRSFSLVSRGASKAAYCSTFERRRPLHRISLYAYTYYGGASGEFDWPLLRKRLAAAKHERLFRTHHQALEQQCASNNQA